MKRIRILGAGLSGLSAAISLAKEGQKVDVFEKNNEVGKRFHGDLEGLENWSEKRDILEELKEMNIRINFDCDPFSTLIITSGSRKKTIVFDRPLFYLVKRGFVPGSFDLGLKEQALELGVTIHFGKTIPRYQADIIATGPRSDEIVGINKGIVFKTEMKDTAILLLNHKAAFRGYAYLLVTRGHGCMCTVVIDDFSSISRCFEETKEIFSAITNLDIQRPKRVGGFGSFSAKNRFEKNESLFVGEAAGLQDFLWGFGMRYAIISGFLAARSILKNENYGEIVKERFSNKLMASLTNRYLWEKSDRMHYSFIVNNRRIIRNLLYSMHNFNFVQRMIYPFAISYMRKRYRNLGL
jgi:flavin-dependent dehydrogenase